MSPVPTLRDVIAQGGTCLTAEGRSAVISFVVSRRSADGGFAGRTSSSDLYYTVFAAATLAALGHRRSLFRLPRYLAQFGDGDGLDFVHLTCLAQLIAGFRMRNRLERLLPRLEAYRSRDGGYNHAAVRSETSSAYAIHLAIEAYTAAGSEPPRIGAILNALETLRASDGGYANTPGQTQGHTNAAAAACIARLRLGLAPEAASAQFLLARHNVQLGGFCAHPSGRLPDLLSTASVLYALNAMRQSIESIAPRCRTFIESLWTDEGGFRGAVDDPVPDCEYTCYALLALGALL